MRAMEASQDFNNSEELPSPRTRIKRSKENVEYEKVIDRACRRGAVGNLSWLFQLSNRWVFDRALKRPKNKDGSTTVHTIIENDETGAQGVHWLHITADGKYSEGIVKLPDGDPQPDGSPTGLVDYKSLLEEAMKNGGAEIVKENNFLETTLGQTLIKDSKTGSIVPYHNPDPDSFLPGDGGGYGGGTGGGFDPNNGMSIVDQLKKGKKKGKNKGKGSGDASSDARNPGYEFSADPALVNPVPELLTTAKPMKKKVRYAPVPALIKKGKKRLRNTAKFYPTIPNRPSPAMTNNSPSRRNGVLRKRRRAASGNFRTKLSQGGMRRKARRHSFSVQHSNRIKVPAMRNRLRLADQHENSERPFGAAFCLGGMSPSGQLLPVKQGARSGSSIPDSSRKSAGRKPAVVCH